MVDENVQKITTLSLKKLLKEIKTGSITCQDAINAFTLKAIEATEITNCVTEFLYDQAIVQARSLDELPIDQRGPLHGLPFSVKEHFFIKDKEFTAGLYTLIGQKANYNAQIGTLALFGIEFSKFIKNIAI